MLPAAWPGCSIIVDGAVVATFDGAAGPAPTASSTLPLQQQQSHAVPGGAPLLTVPLAGDGCRVSAIRVVANARTVEVRTGAGTPGGGPPDATLPAVAVHGAGATQELFAVAWSAPVGADGTVEAHAKDAVASLKFFARRPAKQLVVEAVAVEVTQCRDVTAAEATPITAAAASDDANSGTMLRGAEVVALAGMLRQLHATMDAGFASIHATLAAHDARVSSVEARVEALEGAGSRGSGGAPVALPPCHHVDAAHLEASASSTEA